MPRERLRVFIEMRPRLQAERALMAAQVAMLPHYSGTKTDKNLGQRIRSGIIAGWRQIASGIRDAEIDPRGRTVLKGSKALMAWMTHQDGGAIAPAMLR